MDAASMRRRTPWELFRTVEWGTVATWLLCFSIVVYLGLEGGGYDPLVSDEVGIAVGWIVLVGVLIGALPRRGLGTLAWIALGLFASFAAWTALSLIWTESVDRTWAELARVVSYLGVFALALFLRGPRGVRLTVGAVATGIACVGLVALLSRLHPAWFPEASETARFLDDGRERLSYPINYWNGLAGLIAIGAPLLLQAATCARAVVLRALAAAALPALALAAYLTLSRGGIAAALVALVVFFVFTSDRLPKVLTLLIAGAGSAAVIAAATARDAFDDGFPAGLAESQGDEMAPIVLAVCVAVGLLQGGISLLQGRGRRPRWTRPTRRQSLAFLSACVLGALVLAVALDAPDRASSAWDEFRSGHVPSAGAGRLTSAGGESRFELWSAAIDEGASAPLLGTGAGAFELWWNRNGGEEVVRDAHSLYFQTFGELGMVGVALLGGFFGVVLFAAGWAAIRAGTPGRPQLAAALAGCVAFLVTAAFDWTWQIPVLPVAMLLLGAVAVGAGPERPGRLGWPLRGAIAAAALLAIAAISIPLATTDLLRQSEADARAGELTGALEAARSAENVQPGAAAPRLQQALVLEAAGDLAAAASAARAATERETTNWRNWFVLSRVEAERGRPAAAIRAYRRARSLNPGFYLFE